jgi:hypothetical protein
MNTESERSASAPEVPLLKLKRAAREESEARKQKRSGQEAFQQNEAGSPRQKGRGHSDDEARQYWPSRYHYSRGLPGCERLLASQREARRMYEPAKAYSKGLHSHGLGARIVHSVRLQSAEHSIGRSAALRSLVAGRKSSHHHPEQ